jgi:signal transduction histidine kinase
MEREALKPDTRPPILALGQDATLREELQAILARLGRACRCAASLPEALEAEDAGLVLVELGPPTGCGLETLEALLAVRPGLAILGFVNPAGRGLAAAALRRGALLALDRPVNRAGLESAVRLALHLARLAEVRFPEPALQAMVELQHGLAAGLDGEALWDLLLQLLLRHLKADAGSLLLLEPDGQHLGLAAAYGLDRSDPALGRVRLGERVSGWVAEHDRPQMIVGPGQDDPRLADTDRPDPPEVGLCLPMRGERGVRGVVCLSRQGPREPFVPADVELGLLLAAEAARALERQEAAVRQQELERVALENDKLATLGEMAAGVAHEINNPLAFISSNLNSLRDSLRDVLPCLHGLRTPGAGQKRALERLLALDLDFMLEDIPRCIGETQDGVQRVLRIVRDLRGLSREDRPAKELADPNQVVEGALNVVWGQLKHRAELVRELGPVPSLPCYPSLLGQAVLNLLSNAAQAVEKDGRVVVRTRAEPGWVVIEVEDDGCGMSPEVQQRLFQPFFTTKARDQGTGLGMSVVKRAAERHGGRVEFTSQPGHGTRFCLWLPIPDIDRGELLDPPEARRPS